KAVDPATGEIKAKLRLEYPNYSGALATGGNLVFIGSADGEVSAHEPQTPPQVWGFNGPTAIKPPAISFAGNGQADNAVLRRSRRSPTVLGNARELKNTSTASMLFVFSL